MNDHDILPAVARNEVAATPTADESVGSTLEVLLVALLAPAAVFILFFQGHDAMDRPNPALATARTFYIATALVGLGMAAALVRQGMERLWLRAAIASAIALPSGWMLADAAQKYGVENFFVFFLVSFYLIPFFGGVLLTGAIIAIVKSSQGQGHDGAVVYLVAACGVGFAVAGAALYHLITLSHQADLAREAHETPGLGVMAVVLALLGFVLLQRR